MAQSPANMRPKHPDGTVNWSVVFDDPNRGILQAIDKTTNITQLTGLVTQIAPLLFQRKNDAAVREEFIEKMKGILAGEDQLGFTDTKGMIRRTLEAEKTHRIEEAEKYLANKRAGQSLDRRRSNWSLSIMSAFFGTKLRTISSIGVILIAIIAVALTQIDIEKLITATPPSEEEVAEKATAPETAAPEKPADTPPPAPKRKDETYPVFLMKPLTFLFGNARLSLVPVIVAPAYDGKYGDKDAVCRLAPRIAEALNFTLGPKAAQGQAVSAAELSGIAAKIRVDMDRYLGEDKIERMYLIDTRKFQQPALRTAYRGCGTFELSVSPDDLRAQ